MVQVLYPQYKVNTDSYSSMLRFLREFKDYGFNLTTEEREDDSYVLEKFLEYIDKYDLTIMRLDADDEYIYIYNNDEENLI